MTKADRLIAVLEQHGLTVEGAGRLDDADLLKLRGVGRRSLELLRELAADRDESVVAAVNRDLAALAVRDPDLARSGLAMSALALARELDSDTSATSKSMCARALRDTLDRLWQLAPIDVAADGVDELAERAKGKLQRASA